MSYALKLKLRWVTVRISFFPVLSNLIRWATQLQAFIQINFLFLNINHQRLPRLQVAKMARYTEYADGSLATRIYDIRDGVSNFLCSIFLRILSSF